MAGPWPLAPHHDPFIIYTSYTSNVTGSRPGRDTISSPSFNVPSLQKSLEIFLAKTPTSPTTLPLDSIHFENVTIRKKKEKFHSCGG